MHLQTTILLAATCAALLGCSGTGDGIEPPLDRVYFPVGLTLDAAGEHLLVANSDFDLQFNGGSLQSFDTSRILAFLPSVCPAGSVCPERCGALAPATAADQILVPGPCAPVDVSAPPDGQGSLLTDAIKIGAFATDLLYLARPVSEPSGAPGRVFLPLRGSASLGFVDVDAGGRLLCDADRQRACGARFLLNSGTDAEGAALRLPREQVGLAATEDGRSLVGIHQVVEGPHLSVFDHDWSDGVRLRSVQGMAPTAFGGAFRPNSIALVPAPRARSSSASPSFLVTARTSAEVRLVKLLDEQQAAPRPPQALELGSSPVNANALGSDSRGIATNVAERRLAEQRCAEQLGVPPECALNGECAQALTPAYTSCLADAASIPTSVFVANRSPASLLLGELQRTETAGAGLDLPLFKQTVPLSFGPTHVVQGNILNEQGKLEPRVFALCFDSRLIFVFDPVRGRIETEIRTGRGPQALVIDERRHVGYIAHFTDSYLGVVDLDRSHQQDYGKVVLSIGRPTPPRASK